MAKTLNLEVPPKPIASATLSAEQTTPRAPRAFLNLGIHPSRLLLADTIVAVIGSASAHCELLLASGERVATGREASEVVQNLRDVLQEPIVGCGGRTGFFPDHTFIRLAAISSFVAVDETSTKVWCNNTPAPALIPMSLAQLQTHLATNFDFSVSEPRRIRVAPPSVREEDLYLGSEEERYLDQVHGNAWERMGMPVPGRK